METAGLSTAMVAKATGATVRMISHWARSGLIRPSVRGGGGRGHRRRYAFQDVVAIKTVWDLRKRNCPLQKIRSVLRHLRAMSPDKSPSETLSKLTLLTNGEEVFTFTDERQLVEMLSQQTVWAVPLGKLIIEASKTMDELSEEWIEQVEIAGKTISLVATRESEESRFSVTCRGLPGILIQGTSLSDAISQAKDAVHSVLTYAAKRNHKHRGTTAASA